MTPLNAFMRAENLTDAELAKAVDRDRSTITKLRLGQARPSLDLALKIARISKHKVAPSDYPNPKSGEA